MDLSEGAVKPWITGMEIVIGGGDKLLDGNSTNPPWQSLPIGQLTRFGCQLYRSFAIPKYTGAFVVESNHANLFREIYKKDSVDWPRCNLWSLCRIRPLTSMHSHD